MEPIIIKEYESIYKGGEGKNCLKAQAFDALENFICENKQEDEEAGGATFLSLSVKNGRKVLTAKNYVGVIMFKDGTVIEILPKIAGVEENDQIRSIFIEMLKTLKDAPFKISGKANVDTSRLPLLETFIKMFIDEAHTLTKQGLKSAYITAEENEHFYKGKLLISQHIKQNAANQAKFYVQYDEFNLNRPENKLIKSTLQYLYTKTASADSQSQIRRLISYFDAVDFSLNYDADFAKASNDRTMTHYNNILKWCKLFLKGYSFTPFAGKNIAFAILFPMEKIFESYVGNVFERAAWKDKMRCSLQNKMKYLIGKPKNLFSLEPDIVVEKNDKTTLIFDTKWKILDNKKEQYGISQADMYQMYAYGKKFTAQCVTLIYPKPDKWSEKRDFWEDVVSYESDDGVRIKAAILDLSFVKAPQKIDQAIEEAIKNMMMTP